MSFLDRILGREDERRDDVPRQQGQATVGNSRAQAGVGGAGQDPDVAAVERYRYLLRTAPPDAIEQAHAEAFARLTPEQRRAMLEEISRGVPPAERPADDDPQTLARAATRAEVRQPGFMERSFGGGGGVGPGMGMGAMLGGSLLTSIAGGFIGSSIAHSMFGGGFGPDVVNNYYGDQPGNENADADTNADASADADVADTSAGFDDGGGDFGGDFGGDMGGGFDV